MALHSRDQRLTRLINFRRQPKLSEIEIQFEKSLQIGESVKDDIKSIGASWATRNPTYPTTKPTLLPPPSYENVIWHAHQIGPLSGASPRSDLLTTSLCACECSQQQEIGTHPLPLLVACAKPLLTREALCRPRDQHMRGTLTVPNSSSTLLPDTGNFFEGHQRKHGRRSAAETKSLAPLRSKYIMAARRSSESVEVSPLSKTSSFCSTDDLSSSRIVLSESVERLIRETDDAFRAVGNALADVRVSTQGWEGIGSSSAIDLLATGIGQKGFQEVRKGSEDGPSSLDTSADSVSSIKRRRKRIPSILGTNKKTKIKQNKVGTPSHFPRMKLKDVLTGRAWRIEVDELPHRSPARLPVDDVEERHSIDSNASLGLTPTDPFHLESLTARLEVARNKELSLCQSTFDPPDSGSSTFGVPSVVRTDCGSAVNSTKVALDNGAETAQKTLKFHPAPTTRRRKSKIKHRPTLSKEKMLSAIPELPTPLASPARFPINGKTVLTPLRTALHLPSSPKRYVFLKSTKHTILAPQYRHGPIRIEKPERDHTLFSPVEDRLDWTAFQMAILGTEDFGGGDWRRDWETEADEREVDEIMDWWNGFDYETYGTLETTWPSTPISPTSPPANIQELPTYYEPRIGRREKQILAQQVKAKSPRSRSGFNSAFTQLANLPTHYGRSLPPSRNASRASSHSSPRSPRTASQPPSHHRPRIRSAAELDGTPITNTPSPSSPFPHSTSRGNGKRRDSDTESLPPSPMLDLSQDGGLEARIPMGYNLGHDLGDFLQWEREHVGLGILS